VPYRGKRNEPAFVRFVAETIATLKRVPFEKVADVTSENVYALFGI
jgi:TatD DNase family protein